MEHRARTRHRGREPVFRDPAATRRSDDLAVGRPRALLETLEFPRDGNQCSNHRMGFTSAVSAVSGPAAARGLYASLSRREHGGVLALALAPLRPGDVLEGRAFS